MSRFLPFFLIAFLVISVEAIKAQCSDLFFSEYVEGSSQNKALEIYNPTAKAISLADYVVKRYSNGGTTASESLNLLQDGGPTEIEPYSTLVITNGQLDSTSYGKIDTALYNRGQIHGSGIHGSGDPLYFNGNDAITLEKISTSAGKISSVGIDLIGKVGMGAAIADAEGWSNVTDTTITYNDYTTTPSTQKTYTITNYVVGTAIYWWSWTSNHTLIRKASVKGGVVANPTVFNPSLEWDTVPRNAAHPKGEDIWDNLGKHDCGCKPLITSTDQASQAVSISLFPNPVQNGHFTITASKGIAQVDIYNLLGGLVYSDQGSSLTEKSIDLSQQSEGIYIVNTRLVNQVLISRKLILQGR